MDNTIIPSYLGITPRGEGEGSEDTLTNLALRYGEVREIIYPDNPKSVTKKLIEYEVQVVHRDGTGIAATTQYNGVVASNLFGGIADRLEFTYRADKPKSGVGVGSKVLLLCVSGDQSKAVILGGISSLAKKTAQSGHNFLFEFNGARFSVNDEGEASFLHNGPTDAQGKVLDQYEDYSGSYVRFDKRGNITISTPEGQQYIKFTNQNPDQPEVNKSIEVKADEKLVATGNEVSVTSTGNMFLESTDDAIQMNASRGVFVGSATDRWVKGTSYRLAESTMNQTLAAQFQAQAAIFSTISASLIATAGLNAIPLVGGLLSLPGWLAISGQLAGIAGSMGAIGAAMQSMEAQSDTFLSKNWTD